MGSAGLSVKAAGLLDPQQRFWDDPRVLWTTIALVVGLLLGALAIAWVNRWRRSYSAEQSSSGEELTRFRALYEKGELSREEYERIRARLTQRLRKEWKVPEKPEAPPAPVEPPRSETPDL